LKSVYARCAVNRSESGRLGGIKTSIKFGIHRCPTCGHLAEKSEFHQAAGKKGGDKGGRKTLKLYGREHYVNMGKQGGRGNKKKDGNQGG
jgi:general stress protein YciG